MRKYQPTYISMVVIAVGFLVGSATPVEGKSSLSKVYSKRGHVAYVAKPAQAKFQCLISRLERSGYRIDFMGGYRARGSVRNSKHPSGYALDINQTARNRVTRPFPRNVNSIARSCGVFHGAEWKWSDGGHFEIPGPSHSRRLLKHNHRKYRNGK